MNGISSHCGEERVACKPAQYLGALGLFEGLLGENSGAGKGCPNKGGAPIPTNNEPAHRLIKVKDSSCTCQVK